MNFAPPKVQAFFEAIQELIAYAESTFGLFHDAAAGFGHFSLQISALVESEVKGGVERADALAFPLIFMDQNPVSGPALHKATLGEVIDRCSPHGPNEVFLGNMCLVALYTFWELESRHRIADALDIPLNNVRSDLFGDLRWLRHAVLHKHGKASIEVEKAKILTWFKVGDQIVVDRERLKQIVLHIRSFPDGLVTQGFDPHS
jgi:hypothetical protein